VLLRWYRRQRNLDHLLAIPAQHGIVDQAHAASVAEHIVIGRVQHHLGYAIVIEIFEPARAGARAARGCLVGELLAIEAQQVVAARVRARTALCLQPDIARVDLDLCQATWVKIVVVGQLGPIQLGPAIPVAGVDRDKVALGRVTHTHAV
jgi:hypothetical protein